ncbi:MAG: DUF2628 domain-containing protein [Pseudomonadota bacterium]
MASFMIFEPAEGAARTHDGAESLLLVKDGFTLLAFAFPAIWLLFSRMWLPFLGYLALVLCLQGVGEALQLAPVLLAAVGFAINVWIGFEAGALRRWSLLRKGWRMVGVSVGRNREEAERRAFGWWLADQDRQSFAARPAVPATMGFAADEAPVVGLFPEPEVPR